MRTAEKLAEDAEHHVARVPKNIFLNSAALPKTESIAGAHVKDIKPILNGKREIVSLNTWINQQEIIQQEEQHKRDAEVAAQLQAEEEARLRKIEEEETLRKTAQAEEKAAYQRGFMKGQSDSQQWLKQFGETLKSLIQIRHQLMRDAEQDLVELALKIAEELAQTAIAADKSVIERVIKSCVVQLKKEDHMTVKIAQADAEYLAQLDEKSLKQLFEGQFSLLIEEGLKPGSCVVETKLSKIDATYEERLRNVRTALTLRETRKEDE